MTDSFVTDENIGYSGSMRFTGRKRELARLEEWWRDDIRPGLIWGRRRVGKTALLQRFAEGRLTVFHTGGNRPMRNELDLLSRRIAEALPDELRDLTQRPYRDWDEAFDELARRAVNTPLLLILDEFPELIGQTPELPGILRAVLDRWHDRTGLRILVCGSAVRTMREIQDYRNPLYGRFDMSMQLRPFRPHEAAAMLPDLTPAERARVYGIVGGMPLYLTWWRQDATVEENLSRLACAVDSRMFVEGELVLATEAQAGPHLVNALQAISEGYTKHNEIGDVMGVDPTRTLNDLVELGLVERVQPVTETGRSKRRIYRIADNFLAFYLKALMPVRTEISRGLGETVLPNIVASVDDLMGPAWVEMFRDHLRLIAMDIAPDVIAIGEWWRSGGQDQIDAVVLVGRSRAPILIGEAKWARKVNGARIVAGLAKKSAALGEDVDELRYSICARETVEHAPPGTLVVTADDIFPNAST